MTAVSYWPSPPPLPSPQQPASQPHPTGVTCLDGLAVQLSCRGVIHSRWSLRLGLLFRRMGHLKRAVVYTRRSPFRHCLLVRNKYVNTGTFKVSSHPMLQFHCQNVWRSPASPATCLKVNVSAQGVYRDGVCEQPKWLHHRLITPQSWWKHNFPIWQRTRRHKQACTRRATLTLILCTWTPLMSKRSLRTRIKTKVYWAI